MLAFQANKWFCLVALVATIGLAALSVVCATDLSPVDDPDYEDDMIRATRVFWAGQDQEPAGFERTQKAIITILNQLTAPDVRDENLPAELLNARLTAAIYLDACELSRPKCYLAFDRLAAIKREHVIGDSINQLPYLEVCERAHRKFCDQFGSNENAKKRVWYDLKKEVAREEEARETKEGRGGEKKKSVWPASWPKHIVF